MANSRYSYVRLAEQSDALLPSTFLVLRIDGKGFHRFSKSHDFTKPNDARALDLMNAAARRVVGGKEIGGDCVLAFGESDEYSFVFKRSCKLYSRRSAKLVTLVVSLFSSAYTHLWPSYFPNSPLELDNLPIFDGRIVQYSTEQEVRDYFRWRQVDTHINNLYNTTFWALVHSGLTEPEAHKALSGTVSSEKNETLFTQFGINYSSLPPMFRKGSLILWQEEEEEEERGEGQPSNSPDGGEAVETTSTTQEMSEVEVAARAREEAAVEGLTPHQLAQRQKKLDKKRVKVPKKKLTLVVVHEDLIADSWWESGRGKGLLDG